MTDWLSHDGLYFDRKGEPITLGQWSDLFANPEYKRVALDEWDGIRVSTIWLGLDHGIASLGDPRQIFETMAFGIPTQEWEPCWRWSTEEEALKGHEQIVVLVRGLADVRIPDEP